MPLSRTIASIPQLYRNATRWREIITVLSKYGLADWISRFDLTFAKDLLRARDRQEEALARLSGERRLRLALEELGATAMKLGQVLSTRPDLVGPELACELEKLQTDAPPIPVEEVRERIAAELGRPVEELYARFDDVPLASASIGQVHAAQLAGGAEVVVKVRHPGVVGTVRIDVDILAGLAQLAEHIPELAAYRPTALVNEFRRTVLREVDFRSEERNLAEFGELFSGDIRVKIPETWPDLSTERVLTMERIDGIPLNDRDGVVAAGIDPEQAARNGAEIYIEMIFAHGVFHADPHPGNILLLDDATIGLIDFGMIGRVDERLRESLEEILMAIADGDSELLTSIVTRVGDAPADVDRAALAVDIAEFVAHYGGQPVDRFALGSALRDFTEVLRRYSILLPSRASMLIKVLVMLEGASRHLSPTFNLLEVIRPYRREMMLRRLSPSRQLRKLRRISVEVEHLLQVLPRGLVQIVQQMETGKFDVHLDHRGLEPSVNRLVFGLLTSALFVGSALMMSRSIPPLVGGVSVIGTVGLVVSLVLGIRLLIAIHKSGRLEGN